MFLQYTRNIKLLYITIVGILCRGVKYIICTKRNMINLQVASMWLCIIIPHFTDNVHDQLVTWKWIIMYNAIWPNWWGHTRNVGDKWGLKIRKSPATFCFNFKNSSATYIYMYLYTDIGYSIKNIYKHHSWKPPTPFRSIFFSHMWHMPVIIKLYI